MCSRRCLSTSSASAQRSEFSGDGAPRAARAAAEIENTGGAGSRRRWAKRLMDGGGLMPSQPEMTTTKAVDGADATFLPSGAGFDDARRRRRASTTTARRRTPPSRRRRGAHGGGDARSARRWTEQDDVRADAEADPREPRGGPHRRVRRELCPPKAGVDDALGVFAKLRENLGDLDRRRRRVRCTAWPAEVVSAKRVASFFLADVLAPPSHSPVS